MTERKRVVLLIAVTCVFAVASTQVLVHVAPAGVPATATIAALLVGGALALALASLGVQLGRALDAGEKPPRKIPALDPEGETARAGAQAARQRAWLEAVVQDVAEGAILCGSDHRIVLFNAAAARLLGQPDQLAAGRPLFGLFSREPVLRALEELQAPDAPRSVAFAGATLDAARLVQGRLVLVRPPDGPTAGYVLILADHGREGEILAEDNRLRRTLGRELRQPLANLRAAAETLAAYPGMGTRERAAFDEVVVEESAALSRRLDALDRQFQRKAGGRWAMADIHSQDLFNCLARGAARTGVILNMVGIPLWLRGDASILLSALQVMTAGLVEATRRKSFDLEALLSDRNVYLDISWIGEPVPSAAIETWMDRPAEDAPGGLSVRDVLDRHGSEPWSQKLRNGVTVLRIPLPAPARPQFLAGEPAVFARPEFHNPALLRAHSDPGPLGPRLLSELTFVVFDTETTGLRPADGDAVVQLGAVRVVAGRPHPEAPFDRLVNPGRAVPAESTRYHGITDAMVAGKPPLPVVLRQFKDFTGDAVLVGHNADFDLGFLEVSRMDEPALANPVLDTLLLGLALEPGQDPALAAQARRLGVAMDPKPSALAHAMTTAEVFTRRLAELEKRGIRTLDDALAAQSTVLGGL